jgi:glycerophosphoryl diester phosphodiesterase
LTCFVPTSLEIIRRLAPGQRLLASINQRSADDMGGLDKALDRFAALGGCLVAVEKDLLAAHFAACLERLGRDKLGVWVPNDAEDLAAWLGRPLRQITTDRPDIALGLRRRRE